MVTDRDAQGMRVGHVKDLRNCQGSATDRHGQVVDEKIAQRVGLMTVF